jgi:error-prone DNA polymerase
MSHFVHLDVRSYFSIKEGAFSPEALARRAAELGMRSVALTDRDGLYGAARFVAAGEREGVRPILGASLTVRDSGTLPVRTRHDDRSVVLLARDEAGYANLCRLVTDAHMTGERSDPSLTPEQICAHAGGLVALLGPASPPASLAIAGRIDAGTTALEPYREAFGDRAYVSVQHRLE